jgi:hypothetical protein
VKRRGLILTPVIALAALATLTAPASAASIWTVVPTPNPGGGQAVSDVTFESVSMAGPTEGWAVGIEQVGSLRVPLAEHWDGQAWHAVAAAVPSGRQAWFNGVVDLGPTNAWAVGDSSSPQGSNLAVRTLIEHWNGAAWTIVPSPNPVVGGASGDELDAITAIGPADLWAAGSVHDDVNQDNVLLFAHFDGTSWKAVHTPSPPGSEHFARAITAVASNDVWAVGTVALEETLAAHWNGARWAIVSTPSLHDGISPLNSLTGVTAVASNDVWASGYEGNVDNQNFMEPYVLHWDGSSWTLTPTPNAGGEGSRLNATVALSPSDVWAVGQTQALNGEIFTLTEKFDGTAWKIVPSPSPGGTNGFRLDSLSSVAGVGASGLVAVGAREIAGQCCLRTLALATNAG